MATNLKSCGHILCESGERPTFLINGVPVCSPCFKRRYYPDNENEEGSEKTSEDRHLTIETTNANLKISHHLNNTVTFEIKPFFSVVAERYQIELVRLVNDIEDETHYVVRLNGSTFHFDRKQLVTISQFLELDIVEEE